MNRRRIYYDFEFLEDGETIEPISVGMVDEEGREYYAVFEEIADLPTWGRIMDHDFLCRQVVPHLPVTELGEPDYKFSYALDTYHPDVKKREVIRDEIRDFLLPHGQEEDTYHDIELWAFFSAYDHVSLAQRWGPMMKLPHGIPMRTNDLAQEADRLGVTILPAHPGTPHHALHDARHDKLIGEFLIAQNETWLEERLQERLLRNRVERSEGVAEALFHGRAGAELLTEVRLYNKDIPSDKTILAVRNAVSLGDGSVSEMDTTVIDLALENAQRQILKTMDKEFLDTPPRAGDTTARPEATTLADLPQYVLGDYEPKNGD